MSLRLYTDEDTTPLLARALRREGLDAISAHEINARGLTDEEQLGLATEQGRSIVTSNYRDFLRLSKDWAAANRPHAGIIVSFRQLEPDLVGSSVIALAGLTTMYGEIGLDNCVLALDNYWPD